MMFDVPLTSSDLGIEKLRSDLRAVVARRALSVDLPAELRRVPVRPRVRAMTSAATTTNRSGAEARPRSRGLEHRLIERTSFGWTVTLQEEIERRGRRDYLEWQLHPEAIDDFGLEAALRSALPSLRMTPVERAVTFGEDPGIPIIELAVAKIFRATYSPRQLFERMVELWNDHFHTSVLADFGPFFKATHDLEVIRRHALGRFPDLLRAVVGSPAMLDYLTNDSNVKEHPNENLARELLELHTLGADNGYTQEDVREVARALTGWTFHQSEDLRWGTFRFARREHDEGPKTFLGIPLPAGRGIEDADDVLGILAEHPETARFVARKILRHFWGYVPRAGTVEELAQVYLATGGDLGEMARRALTWYELAKATPKLKRPFHLVTSALRSLFVQLAGVEGVLVSLLEAGHFPFFWGPPNGVPDDGSYWADAILPRLNFALETFSSDPGLELDLGLFEGIGGPEEAVAVIDVLTTFGTLSDHSRGALYSFLTSASVDPSRMRQAMGLAIAAPEFQYY